MQSRLRQAITNVGIAEVLSAAFMFCGLGWLNKHPHHLDKLEKKIAKKAVEPHLEWFEKIGAGSGYLEPEEYQRRHKKSRIERAHKIAKPMSELAATGATGWAVGYALQQGTNYIFANKIEGYQKFRNIGFAKCVDPAVQLGTVLVLATVAQKYRKQIAHTVSTVLQKTLGMDKKDADRFANYTALWKTSDAAGAVSKVGIMTAGIGAGLSARKLWNACMAVAHR